MISMWVDGLLGLALLIFHPIAGMDWRIQAGFGVMFVGRAGTKSTVLTLQDEVKKIRESIGK